MERFEKKVWLSSPTMHGEEIQYVQEAYDTNWMSTVGENLNVIEKKICEKVGCKYAVALSCGTAALHLAVKLAGVKDGDYVRAGQPIGVEGSSGAGKADFLTLEFRRTGRHVDGCGLLGIDCVCPQEGTEPADDTPHRLVDADALLQHAVEMVGSGGSEAVVPVRCILEARVFEEEKK